MINDKIFIGYLTYVNDSNRNRRYEIFEKSLNSLSYLKYQATYLVNFDNNSTNDIKKKISSSNFFDLCAFLEDNFLDISVLFGTAYLAKKMGFEYCLYTYDDFVVFNDNFVNDTLAFLNTNRDVHCVRVPIYSYDYMQNYDSEIVPKSCNPDSIRHYNTQTRKPLNWSGAIAKGGHVFYKNNWHYTSRPTIWRTDTLLSLFDDIEEIPVMQAFEGIACKKMQSLPLVTGVLDGGAMKTFKQSERMTVKNETDSNGPGQTINTKVNKKQFLKLLHDLM